MWVMELPKAVEPHCFKPDRTPEPWLLALLRL
jgi:hypothetical protein